MFEKCNLNNLEKQAGAELRQIQILLRDANI